MSNLLYSWADPRIWNFFFKAQKSDLLTYELETLETEVNLHQKDIFKNAREKSSSFAVIVSRTSTSRITDPRQPAGGLRNPSGAGRDGDGGLVTTFHRPRHHRPHHRSHRHGLHQRRHRLRRETLGCGRFVSVMNTLHRVACPTHLFCFLDWRKLPKMGYL